jgi:RNA polymerase sigma-70 factor (ECF subfamily)
MFRFFLSLALTVNGGPTPHNAGRASVRPERDRYSALMGRAQAGDGEAYNTLLSEIEPIISICVGRRVSRVVDRGDLVQEVLLSIHLSRDSFDPSRPFLPWMKTILNHRLVDYFRSANRRGKWGGLSVNDDVQNALTLESGSEANVALTEVVATFSESQRELFRMLTDTALSRDEMADLLGVEPGNLRVQIHRLGARIREALD